MIMRRILSLLLLVFIMCGCANTTSNHIEICQGKSSLIEFYEDDGIVHIICRITLHNTTDEDQTIRIKGISQEDVDSGLLLSPYLSGLNAENQEELFRLNAGQYSEFLVDFCGVYAGILQKHDRLVPDVIELEIVE